MVIENARGGCMRQKTEEVDGGWSENYDTCLRHVSQTPTGSELNFEFIQINSQNSTQIKSTPFLKIQNSSL